MPATADPNPETSEDVDPNEDEYEWLQQQLEQVGATLAAGGIGDDGEPEWEDPSNDGVLGSLIGACEDGNVDDLVQLLGQLSVHVDTPGPDGDSCLQIASLHGHEACVQQLLDAGSKADAVNPEDGSTALHDAAASGALPIVKLLLERSAAGLAGPSFVNKADEDGDTPLHNAARGDHLEVVKFLLEHGADPNARNNDGATPADEAEVQEVKDALRAAAAAGGGR